MWSRSSVRTKTTTRFSTWARAPVGTTPQHRPAPASTDTLPSTPSKCKCGSVPVGEVIVRKAAQLEVIKDVVPDDAPGQFNLLVDGVAEATGVGDLGTTGVLTVAAGTNKTPGATHTVGEAASGTTNLADYSIAISCVERGTNNVVAVATGAGPLNVPVQSRR